MRDNTRKNTVARPLWIDWLILLSIAALVFLAVNFIFEKRAEAVPNIALEYVICQTEQKQALADENDGWEALMPVGATVSNENGTAYLGDVSGISIRPSVVPTVQAQSVTFIERRGFVDLYITVRGMATHRAGDGMRIGDIRIAAGTVGDFRIGSYYAARARIVSVREVIE